MYVILQKNENKLWFEASSLSIKYYSFNDDEQSITIDGRHFREGARLLVGCEDEFIHNPRHILIPKDADASKLIELHLT